MPKTVICLWFDTEAEQAARFYTSVWPDAALLGPIAYGPQDPQREGQVLTASFRLGDTEFLGLNGGKQDWAFSEAISFQIMCADQAEVDHYWDRLTEGGEESQCGWLKDRFGVSWQVIPTEMLSLLNDPDPGRARRATQAMLQMRRIDMAEIKRAADSVSV